MSIVFSSISYKKYYDKRRKLHSATAVPRAGTGDKCGRMVGSKNRSSRGGCGGSGGGRNFNFSSGGASGGGGCEGGGGCDDGGCVGSDGGGCEGSSGEGSGGSMVGMFSSGEGSGGGVKTYSISEFHPDVGRKILYTYRCNIKNKEYTIIRTYNKGYCGYISIIYQLKKRDKLSIFDTYIPGYNSIYGSYNKRFEHQIIKYRNEDKTMYALSYPDDIIKQFYRMISYIVFIHEGKNKYTDELNFLKTEHKEYNALRDDKVIELPEPILNIIQKVSGIPIYIYDKYNDTHKLYDTVYVKDPSPSPKYINLLFTGDHYDIIEVP